MAGDYSRQTHDPRKRFASVLMQQGRVQVDADWNEQATLVLERARRQARDTFGRAAVSRFSTDQAFRIGIIAGPPRDLSIAPGRMYVEGHLAEAFPGDGAPISYLRQPFLPEPPALPASGGANVFLDVWQREVTWVEDPALLDVALGGVDTAARLQAVWQVKLAAVRQAGCGADPDALFPPSPARLTTRAVAPPAPEDPCLIAPKTGYRGLENRLYRVEVHTGGPTAAARFKFSRDNASVRSPVTGMRREMRGTTEVTILSVSRIGRDPALRISAGDWVEITDEHRFLNGESGVMAQVAEPPLEEPGQGGFSVVLDRVIPPASGRAFGATPAALAERRTRVIRWDQAAPRNTLDANGLMAVAGGMISLEEGVEVDFTLEGAGAQYRAGDWWIFAARTADASVEELTAAPPHGPIHHVAQLAAISDISRSDDPQDCRTLWPPVAPQGGDGCCTVVIRPGESIQAAIDSLPQAGGCVCLKPGVHPLQAPVLIRRSRVSLHAEAPGSAFVTRAMETPLLVIGDPVEDRRTAVTDITVEGIAFQLGSVPPRTVDSGMVAIAAGAERVRIAHCRFVVQDESGMVSAVHTAGHEVSIEGAIVERVGIGIRAEGDSADLIVRDCAFIADPSDQISAGRPIAALPSADRGIVAVAVLACTGGVRVTGNTCVGYRIGILLGDGLSGGKGLGTTLALVADNIVLRGGPRQDAEQPAPPPTPTPGTATPVGVPSGSLVASTRATLAADAISLSAPSLRAAGIGAMPSGLSVEVPQAVLAGATRLSGATPVGTAPTTTGTGPAAGPATGPAAGTRARGASQPAARAALVATTAQAPAISFAIVAAAGNATVSENVIAWRGELYGAILAGPGARLVAGNDIVAARGDADDGEATAIGIATGLESEPAPGLQIIGNMVTGRAYAFVVNACDAALVQGNLAVGPFAGVLAIRGEGVRIDGNGVFNAQVGLMAINATRLSLTGNLISACAAQGILGMNTDRAPTGRVFISGNTLLRCGARAEQATAIAYAALDPEEQQGGLIDATELVVEHNTIHDTGWPRGGERARIAHAMSLTAPRVTVHGNDVLWEQPAANDPGARLLAEEQAKPHRAILLTPIAAQGLNPAADGAWAGAATITDNRVRGPSIDMLVEVRAGQIPQAPPVRFREVLVSGNMITHWRPRDTPGGATATVTVRAPQDGLVSVSANVIRGVGRSPSVLVDGPREIAWVGNATSGPLIGTTGAPNVIV